MLTGPKEEEEEEERKVIEGKWTMEMCPFVLHLMWLIFLCEVA
jgi:hypothetical protein